MMVRGGRTTARTDCRELRLPVFPWGLYGWWRLDHHRYDMWCVLDFVPIMNNLLKRVLVGVCIALVMMFVHKVVRASTFTWSNGYPDAISACTHYAQPPVQPGDVVTVQPVGATYAGAMFCFVNGRNGNATVSPDPGAVCNPPNVVNSSGACVAPLCTAGAAVKFRYDSGPRNRTAANTPPQPNNTGGCYVKLTDIGTCSANQGDTSSNPHIYCWATAQQTGVETPPGAVDSNVPSTGQSANPEPTQTQGNSDGSCPNGTANIGSDSSGTPVCRGNGTSSGDTKNTSITTPTTTATNGDGSTTTSSSTSNGNNDGSTTTITTTCTTATNGAKSCSISGTTSPNAAGGAGKSDGKPDDPKDFCATHPDLTVCVNSTVTGSGCNGASANLAFTGDAVQGAILRDERNLLCANSQVTPMSTLGNQIQNGTDPMQGQIDVAKAGTTVDLSSNALDQSGFLGGGGGFQDQTVSVAGHSLVLRFSKITDGVENLKYVVLACSLIAAYLLVSKSVIQGV